MAAYPLIKPTQGTAVEGGEAVAKLINKENVEKAKLSPREKCKQNGGFWDEATGTCLMGPPKATTAPNVNTSQPTGQYDPNKGGYTQNDGKFFPTSNPNFVPGLVPGKTEKGYKSVEDQKKFQDYDQKKAAVLQQQAQAETVGGLGLSEQEIAMAQNGVTEAGVNWGPALTQGVAGAAPAGIAAAAGGLLASSGVLASTGVGAPVAVGTLAAAGALYAISKLWNGVQSNIKAQQSGEIASTKKYLSNAKTNMRQLAVMAAKDPSQAERYVQAYNQQLAQVYRAQAKLKLETSGNLNAFMEDGTQDLAEFDLFLQPMGMADIYKQKLEMALLSGVPPDFTAEDLAMLE
jgi:hypothetical protein